MVFLQAEDQWALAYMSNSEATPAERAQLGFRDEVTGSRAAVGTWKIR